MEAIVDGLVTSLKLDKPTHLAIGAYIWNDHVCSAILKRIQKEFPEVHLILGGPQVSYSTEAELLEEYPEVGTFIKGYAEEALRDVVLGNSAGRIVDGRKTALEELRSPILEGVLEPKPMMRWETQRGCPFQCAFCQHREPATAQRQAFALSRLGREIEWFVAHSVQKINVLDPIFNSGPNYLAILNRFADLRFTGTLSLQVRAEMVTPEFLAAVERVFENGGAVNLEFGLQTIHKNEQRAINRLNNMRRVDRVLKETVSRNIPTEVSLIYGLPLQTVDSFHETIDYVKTIGVPKILAFPLMLLRGTSLYYDRERYNLETSVDYNHFLTQNSPAEEKRLFSAHIPHVISSSTFDVEDWIQMATTVP